MEKARVLNILHRYFNKLLKMKQEDCAKFDVFTKSAGKRLKKLCIQWKKKGRGNMVRGTNKMIIEINETGSPYFERAVLYLKDRPQGRAVNKGKMEEEAQSYIAAIQTAKKPRLAFLKGGLALKLTAAAAGGGVVSFLIFSLFL